MFVLTENYVEAVSGGHRIEYIGNLRDKDNPHTFFTLFTANTRRDHHRIMADPEGGSDLPEPSGMPGCPLSMFFSCLPYRIVVY